MISDGFRLLAGKIITGLVFSFKIAVAQPDTLTVPQSSLSIQYDNDFFNATDRYYTQGIFFRVGHPALRHSPFFYLLPKQKNGISHFELIAEQEVFTPRSIRYKGGAIYTGERPFTAFFLLSHQVTHRNSQNKTVLTAQLDLGFMGPTALGEEEQKAIHKSLNNIEPQGWDNQLSQDFLINYRLGFEKNILRSRYFEFNGVTMGRLGSLYTDAAAGFRWAVGKMNPLYNSQEVRTKPASGVACYLTLNALVKLVGYNATLQGGFFADENIYELPDESITRVVANLSAGITLRYRKVALTFTKQYITPEFAGGVDHGWGSCLITIYF